MTTQPFEERGRHRVVLAGITVYAGVASLSRPLTDAAVVAVAVPCVVVLLWAGMRRRRAPAVEDRRRVRRTSAVWVAVVAVAVAMELAAWLQQPAYNVASHDHPTVSILLDPLIEPWPWRFAAWCGWLYLGYRLVRR